MNTREQAVLEALPYAAAIVKARKVRKGQPRRRQFKRAPLYTKQAAIVDDLARFTMTEATPKAGKTMSHIEWLLEEADTIGEGHFWWVATVSSTARMAFRRVCDRLDGIIDSRGAKIRIADPIPYRKHETELWIRCFGDAWLWFKSADHPDTLYGEDVRRAVGDEITRWKEAAWTALYTTLVATKGRAKLIGNVKGRRNFAFRLARKAQGGAQDWGYHKLTAYDAADGGIIDPGIIEQAQRDLVEAVFKELFLAEAADDVGNPFGLAAIAACTAPLSLSLPEAWGWDLAKSVDWTVGIGLDPRGDTCRAERWNKHQLPPAVTPGLDYWELTEARIRNLTGQTRALIDSTGLGDPVVERIAKGRPGIKGFVFSSAPSSKQQLMEGLALAIQQRRVRFPAGVVTNELESFEYEYTRQGVRYSAPEGMHDDCVCALALAVHALGHTGKHVGVWGRG